jgi:hypothetical protein
VNGRIAYADPPYPGRAHLYVDHSDYAGEVDHHVLLEQLQGYDGWALSTSADSLSWLLPLCPPAHRVLAWVKHTITVGWEPVIVVSARRPDRLLRDWLQCEPDSYQWRPKPETYVIGQKPELFCDWLFGWLGARPGDEFVDLFPGSGQVGRAWERWSSQPTLPTARTEAGENRAERRALKKALAVHPQLPFEEPAA